MTARGDMRGGGLYLHIPFCASLCSYCHFARTARHDADLRARVARAIVREFVLRAEHCQVLGAGTRPLATAYVGGGTPSLLDPPLMQELLAGTVGRLPHTAEFELTAEANPESLDAEIVAAWRDAGINRISLGVQSLDAGVLALLGRHCDPATARGGLRLARAGFARVSADWILAPGVTRDGLCAELDEAIDLGVEHISLYILELHAGTPLAAAVAAGRVRRAPSAVTEAIYLAVVDHLERRGLRQYEMSNFARPGAESRHNRAYWQGYPYLGLGPSAHGFWGRRRYANEANPTRYVARVEAGEVPEASVDPLDLEARRLEAVILPLRTAEGVPLARVPSRELDLPRGEREGLWTVADDRLRLTPRGFLHLDTIEERIAATSAG